MLVLRVLQALVDSSAWPPDVHVRWLEERALRQHLSAVQDAVMLRSTVREFASLARVRLSEVIHTHTHTHTCARIQVRIHTHMHILPLNPTYISYP